MDGVEGLGSPLDMRPNPPFAQLVPLSAPLGGDENCFKGKKLNATSPLWKFNAAKRERSPSMAATPQAKQVPKEN